MDPRLILLAMTSLIIAYVSHRRGKKRASERWDKIDKLIPALVSTHLSYGTVLSFVEDKLDPAARASAVDHLVHCEKCQQLLGEISNPPQS